MSYSINKNARLIARADLTIFNETQSYEASNPDAGNGFTKPRDRWNYYD